jgi:hypothetical protein
MKTLTFTLLLFAGLFLITCKKDNSGGNDNTLTGKWKLTETLDDPGNGSGKWMAVPQKANYDYVTFNSSGKLGGTVFSTDVTYALKDSITLTFTSKDGVLQNYRYSIKNGTLVMSPAGPIMCIEGCGIKFIKVR